MDKKRLERVLKEKEILVENLRNRGIDELIIHNTVSDIQRRQNRYIQNEGKEGLYLSDDKWLAPLLRGEFISLNTFRFQIFPMDYKEIEREGFDYLPLSKKNKELLPEGKMCLNVHIPDGADLSNKDIFKQAKQFFDTHYPEYTFHYFVIRSWIVYKPMKEILTKKSKISQFMDHFETVTTSHTNKIQPFYRIFGLEDLDEIQATEWETSLQRSAKDNIDKLGVSFSIKKY